MTRADVVAEIANQTGIDKGSVERSIEAFMGVVRKNMSKGENIYLRGFGSFILKRRAEKLARNIRKGTSVTIPAHNVPVFKPVKEFVNEVSEGTSNITIPGL